MSIRECFVAPPNSIIVEFDYKQLEVRVLAALSRDPTLIKHLREGIDMHCMSAAFLMNTWYDVVKRGVDLGTESWVKARKAAKAVSFLVQYGGGAKTASKNTGVPVAQVQTYIDNYNRTYPMVKEFHKKLAEEIQKSRISTTTTTAKGVPAGLGLWTAPTGRVFSFIEHDSDFSSTGLGFSPTQYKNYPVQGTGWDIVGLMMTKVDTYTYDANIPAEFCNTVHDSLMYYIPEDNVECIPKIKEVLENVNMATWDTWKWDTVGVDFPVDCKVGTNWSNLTEV